MTCTATDDEIINYLNSVKTLIKDENKLIISTNRSINLDFMSEYSLKKKNVIEVINSLSKDDFEDKVVNNHLNFSNEILYIFSKTIELVDISGIKKLVTIYIKFNVLNNNVILISFHEAKYKFKGRK